MGLSLRDRIRQITAGWALPATILAVSLAVHFGGDSARTGLRYDRAGIVAGEFYRLLSGHLTHLDASHLVLNLAGLALVWVLVGSGLTVLEWAIVFLASAVAIDAAMWWLMPELDWYVGLSGVLHGLLAAGIVATWRNRRLEARVLAVAVSAKLAWETLVGPMPGSSDFVASAVLTEAHLFGAIGGLAAAVLIVMIRRRRYNAPPAESEPQ